MRSVTIAALAAGVGSTLLAGCSGAATDTGEAPATTAECTVEVLQPLVDEQASALGRGNTMPIDDLQCADGWAVATGTLQPKGEPGTFIFQGQGAQWVWQEPAVACSRTADASLVPTSLYDAACGGAGDGA